MKSIELFAGAGGMALGLEMAHFQTIGLIERDKDCVQTLRNNRPNWNVVSDDVASISGLDLEDYFRVRKGELDLLVGGAPCQSFSYAGKRLGLEDTRGTLFYHYAIFLNKLQPKVFLFENVKGMLNHDNGQTFNTILNVFKTEGYEVQFKILNANDYGIAQKRERLIIIGIRNDLEDVTVNWPPVFTYKAVLKQALQNVPESLCAEYPENKKKLFDMIPPGGYWKDLPEELAKKYMGKDWEQGGGSTGLLRRLSFDEPSLTILTTPAQKRTERCHPSETRPLSVRECARIQSFPDEWQFSGGMSSQYRQIGNAVPPLLAFYLGVEINQGLLFHEFHKDYKNA
jgi:DNA (cytosine-5)-methyltransferase 1